jgi:hypothetical protein
MIIGIITAVIGTHITGVMEDMVIIIPTTYGIYQITQGAVSVDILDLKNAPSKNKIDIIWNGLARGKGIFNESNADGIVKSLV